MAIVYRKRSEPLNAKWIVQDTFENDFLLFDIFWFCAIRRLRYYACVFGRHSELRDCADDEEKS